jgi:hypothetical protein
MHRFDEDIQLARRLDDPGQEQLPDYLISAGGLAELSIERRACTTMKPLALGHLLAGPRQASV